MSARSGAVPGADQISFHVDEDTVIARCVLHPDFAESFSMGADRRVPGGWFVHVLASHLKDHSADDSGVEEAAAEERSPAVASPLDDFGREVAARCRWSVDANSGEPDDDWPIDYRIAVALVLGNLEYLSDMGPGPGYTPAQAAVRLVRGMTPPPANLDAWINAIRAEIKPPGDTLWLPSAHLRTDP